MKHADLQLPWLELDLEMVKHRFYSYGGRKVVLYGCEIWFLALMEEHKVRVQVVMLCGDVAGYQSFWRALLPPSSPYRISRWCYNPESSSRQISQ
jgi:hypothetical protein